MKYINNNNNTIINNNNNTAATPDGSQFNSSLLRDVRQPLTLFTGGMSGTVALGIFLVRIQWLSEQNVDAIIP